MTFQVPITIKEAIIKIQNGTYALPVSWKMNPYSIKY